MIRGELLTSNSEGLILGTTKRMAMQTGSGLVLRQLLKSLGIDAYGMGDVLLECSHWATVVLELATEVNLSFLDLVGRTPLLSALRLGHSGGWSGTISTHRSHDCDCVVTACCGTKFVVLDVVERDGFGGESEER